MNLITTSVQEKRALPGVQRWLPVSFRNWPDFWLSCFGCTNAQRRVEGNTSQIRYPTPELVDGYPDFATRDPSIVVQYLLGAAWHLGGLSFERVRSKGGFG